MIRIEFKDGTACEWENGQYSDYKYDGKSFIVLKGEKQSELYNMDSVKKIVIDR